MKLPVQTKPWIQGALAGAVIAVIAGFSWGGWYTGGTYSKDVYAAKHEGAVTALIPVCVDKFKAQPDAAAKLAELAKASFYERRNMIDKSGFATIGDNKSGDSDLAGACAEALTAAPKS